MISVRPYLASSIMLMLALTACTSGHENGGGNGQYASGGTFTLSVTEDPGNLDPALTVLGATRLAASFAYDTLLATGPNGKLIPWLATKWASTPTSVTYTLRDDVTCADGATLTVTDVAENFSFIADPKNKSPLLGVFVPIGLKAKADKAAHTVTLTVPKPETFLLQKTGPTVFIVCKEGMDDRSLLERETHGTGLFKLTESRADDHYTFTKRDNYTWGPGGLTSQQKGLPDSAVLKVVKNQTTATNLLLTGQVNATKVLGPDRDRLDAQKLFVRESKVTLGEMYFNQTPGRPGADENVRKALTMALDLNELGRVMTNGTGTPSKSLVTLPPDPCHDDSVQSLLPDHNTAQAESLLDEAGWVKGANGIRVKDGNKLAFTFVYLSGDGDSVAAGAELLSQTWSKIGAKVQLKGVSETAFTPIIFGSGSWDAGWVPLVVGLPDVLKPFFSGATPPEGTNFAHIDNADYLKLAEKASTLAGDGACKQWADAGATLVEQLDVIPFVDGSVPTYGKGAVFEIRSGSVDPLSIRMLAK